MALIPFNNDGALAYKRYPVKLAYGYLLIGDFGFIEPAKFRGKFENSKFWFRCVKDVGVMTGF